MLAVARLDGRGDDLTSEGSAALQALAARPGFVRGRLGRLLDEPGTWLLVTEWDSVGAYRRGLSAYDVKLAATPLLLRARDEPGAVSVELDVRPA